VFEDIMAHAVDEVRSNVTELKTVTHQQGAFRMPQAAPD
jgi:hypothetical protein